MPHNKDPTQPKNYKTEKINRQKEQDKNQHRDQSQGNGPLSLFRNPPFTSLPDYHLFSCPAKAKISGFHPDYALGSLGEYLNKVILWIPTQTN